MYYTCMKETDKQKEKVMCLKDGDGLSELGDWCGSELRYNVVKWRFLSVVMLLLFRLYIYEI